MNSLAITTLLPLVGGALALLLPAKRARLLRGYGLAVALLTFVQSLFVLAAFEAGRAGFQMEVDWTWVPALGIRFHLGIDGISLWLVLLSTLMVLVTLLSPQAQGFVRDKNRGFVAAMLLLESGMIGAFLAIDLFAFYVFWELMLVPMYFIIGLWGGERRVYAAIKFMIFTLVGSLLMLAAILFMAVTVHGLTGQWTFDYTTWSRLMLPENAQLLCFGAFALAFLIKVPLFPLHTWLPDAHVEAPTGGSVILAAVLLKLGAYGFLRFALPFFPLAAHQTAPLIAWLAVAGIVYGALMAYAQDDIKKLVAYSSVSHLGFVVLGILTFGAKGVQGGIFQMLAHGISTGGLWRSASSTSAATRASWPTSAGCGRAPRSSPRASWSSCSPPPDCPVCAASWASSWCSSAPSTPVRPGRRRAWPRPSPIPPCWRRSRPPRSSWPRSIS
jgi:NADH-quinone oxidoreductase subunit M